MGHLARFVDDARARVRAGGYASPVPVLQPNGSLRAGVLKGSGIVAELKPRSPTRGRLLAGSAEAILEAYLEGGACALSILADADHFDGSPELVRRAHAVGLPILFKDFVVTPEQVACAAACGASAVLIIERCFASAAEREHLVEVAQVAGLEVLLEVHGASEWERARDSAADLFGVNARNLDTLEIDMAGSVEVVRGIAAAGRPVLALSGIRTRKDVARARSAGASGVLVGTSLLEAADAALAVRALQRPLVKVCGLTRIEDVEVVAAAGADLAGFVVEAPGSPRSMSPEEAAPLAARARAAGLRPVLVTPHPDPEAILAWCQMVRPAFVQVHGWTPRRDWIEAVGGRGAGVLVAVGPDGPVPRGVAGFVIDTPPEAGDAAGGTGRTHDWSASARLVGQHPAMLSLVAGGLGPDNVGAALGATGATGADASSRLETAPGIKDPERVRAYVAAAHL